MIPPDDRIGSTRQAASAPVDCWSTAANPYASSASQSSEPSGRRNGERYPLVVGRVRFPGKVGPYPRRPAEYVAAAAPEVMPCQDRSNETISYLPVYSFAILMAASLDSAPVVNNSVLV